MQIQKNRWLKLAFFAVVGLIFLFALIFPEAARRAIKKDREEAVPRVGVASVAILVPAAPAPLGDNPSPPIVSVRFRGRVVPVQTVVGFSQLQLGQTVQIVYRIGRSGRIYVDRIKPMPAPNLKIGVRR
ncbi:MAG TPA: hypothetical protein VFA07_04785 [Chthonomonadaceae bacterium]|nr:hypothetical protein [Chthonomonadaceae bacterium]